VEDGNARFITATSRDDHQDLTAPSRPSQLTIVLFGGV
jgi:hypothetical protein